jgi:hypothetical protein
MRWFGWSYQRPSMAGTGMLTLTAFPGAPYHEVVPFRAGHVRPNASVGANRMQDG